MGLGEVIDHLDLFLRDRERGCFDLFFHDWGRQLVPPAVEVTDSLPERIALVFHEHEAVSGGFWEQCLDFRVLGGHFGEWVVDGCVEYIWFCDFALVLVLAIGEVLVLVIDLD